MRGEARGGAFRERLIQALCELVRGYDAADREAGGTILGPRGDGALAFILAGSISALLRVMVLAFAAEHGLLAENAAGVPAALHADLDQERRRGGALDRSSRAWGRLAAAFRAVHAAQGGGLFDPSRFPFLERGGPSDAAVLAVLDRLLFEDGGRVRWAELEVEALGAAYEALLGLELRVATGDSLLLLPVHVGVDLEALLEVPGPGRAARLEALIGVAVRGRLAAALASADSVAALRAALGRRASARWPASWPFSTPSRTTSSARSGAG